MSDGGDGSVGPADFRGGRVASFDLRDGSARVVVMGESGRECRLKFGGVRSLVERRAAGMLLFALVHRAPARGDPRTFTFVGGDESAEQRMKSIYGVERVAFLFTGGDVKHAHAHVVPMHAKTDITSARYIVPPHEVQMSADHLLVDRAALVSVRDALAFRSEDAPRGGQDR